MTIFRGWRESGESPLGTLASQISGLFEKVGMKFFKATMFAKKKLHNLFG